MWLSPFIHLILPSRTQYAGRFKWYALIYPKILGSSVSTCCLEQKHMLQSYRWSRYSFLGIGVDLFSCRPRDFLWRLLKHVKFCWPKFRNFAIIFTSLLFQHLSDIFTILHHLPHENIWKSRLSMISTHFSSVFSSFCRVSSVAVAGFTGFTEAPQWRGRRPARCTPAARERWSARRSRATRRRRPRLIGTQR